MPKRRQGIRLLDTVALLEDLPDRKLRRGEVGTVVESLAPGVYEVEFCVTRDEPMPSWRCAWISSFPCTTEGKP